VKLYYADKKTDPGTDSTLISNMWRAPWKNRTSRYISFFRPSRNAVLFPMFCLLVEGECQIIVF